MSGNSHRSVSPCARARSTAVFAFEGIGLVLPVYESMREPEKFTRVLSGVMVGSMTLFASGGLLAYLAYGSDIQVRAARRWWPLVGLLTLTLAPAPLPDGRLHQPAAGRQARLGVPVPLLDRDPPVDPTAALPRRAHHGERPLCAREERQAQPQGQVGEEQLPDARRRRVLDPGVGGRKGPRQVCQPHRERRVVRLQVCPSVACAGPSSS